MEQSTSGGLTPLAELLKAGRIGEAMTMARKQAPRSDYLDNPEEYIAQRDARMYNSEVGHEDQIDGIQCETCKNKGFVAEIRRDLYPTMVLAECPDCAKKRQSMRRMRASGLGDAITKYTFVNFEIRETWQAKIRDRVGDFAEADEGWLYMGGQPGAGKTHLCTAASVRLMHRGKFVRYMLWTDIATRLKGLKLDDEEYQDLINPLKSCDVLYIDDIFKQRQGMQPSQADVALAFEIINARYIRRDSRTIISGEMTTDQIIDLDEALGSRIIERSRGHIIDIPRDKGKNWRMRMSEF